MSKQSSGSSYDFIENKDNDREFQRYALSYSLKYFLLKKKNYTAISNLYSGMNLYDNTELLRLLHAEGRGAGVWFSGIGSGGAKKPAKGQFAEPDAGLSFSTVIYEDIIKLAVSAVVDRHDSDLLRLIQYFIDGALTAGSEEDEFYKKCYELFLSLYDEEKPRADYSFARSFYRFIFADNDDAENQGLNMSFFEMMLNISAGTYMEKEDFLGRTVDDVIRAMARFFGVGSGLRVYGAIRRFHPKQLARMGEGESLRRQTGLIKDLLATYRFPMDIFGNSSSEWTDRKIRGLLEDIVASYYPDAVRRQRNDDPKDISRPPLKYFPPIERIVSELYFLLVTDAAVSSIAALQEDYYRDFDFDKITKLETVKEMTKSVSEMQKKLQLANGRCEELSAKLSRQDKMLRDRRRDINEAFHDELAQAERELSALRQENEELRNKSRDQEEYIKLLEAPEEKATGKEADTGRLLTKRFLFVGGQQEIVQSLRHQFQNAVFTENETQQVNLANVDYIVMFVKFMSHALYYKYIDAARSLGIPVIYCNMSNYDMVIRKISDSCEETEGV